MSTRRALALLLGAVAAASGQGCTAPPLSPGSAETSALRFRAAPIVLGEHATIDQMGFSFTADVEPYIRFGDTRSGLDDSTRAVVAPAQGVVTSVTSDPLERVRVEFAAAGGYRFYLTGLESASVVPGQSVQALDRVGTRPFNRVLGAISLGVINPTLTGLFVNPSRYRDDLRFADYPLRFFSEPLRSELRAKLRPANADPAISFDVQDRLMGMWYLPSVPVTDSAAREHRAGRLWFYYTYYPGTTTRTLRVDWGDWSPLCCTHASLDQGPNPADVSVASGIVQYHVPENIAGLYLLVQMIDTQTVRAEVFDGYYNSNPRAFTSKARTYTR